MAELRFYTQSELADALHVSTKTLESMRYKGCGPRYYKLGRKVMYRDEDIEQYLAEHKHGSTSEY